MRLWQPHPAEPELMDWYRPLLAAARRARAHQVPWQVHAEEFDLLGRADCEGRAAVWVYRHRGTGGLVCTDVTGHTYRYVPNRGRPGEGRFAEASAREAVLAAGLAEWPALAGRAPGRRGRGHLRVVPDQPTVA